MALVLQTETDPGSAIWSELSESIQVFTHRRSLALETFPANVSSTVAITSALTLDVPVLAIGATYYLTTSPLGPGLGSLEVTVTGTNGTYLEQDELFGGAVGFPNAVSTNRSRFTIDPPNNSISPVVTTTTFTMNLTADINLSLLTALDVTIYVFYSKPSGLIVPV